MRINSQGKFEYCRWSDNKLQPQGDVSIVDVSPIIFFQKNMADLRVSMTRGEKVDGCSSCYSMNKHGKVSGQARQLIKIGVKREYYDKSFSSSPWFDEIKNADLTNGETDLYPQDWQIDLGNYCNSACVMCSPRSSSRLASEWMKLKLITELPPRAWCDDEDNLRKFIEMLTASKKLSYIHFIGGETLITPAFKTILQGLIASGLHQQVVVGFTTNITVWDDTIVDLLIQFKEVNLGLSIESLHAVNDYIRYPSKIELVNKTMTDWTDIAKKYKWSIQLRTTPTILSVLHLDSIFDYAYTNEVAVESCDFLVRPEHLRATLLPPEYRKVVIDKLKTWVSSKEVATESQIVNTRDPPVAKQQVVEDAKSYINYLENQPDESYRLPELIKYLKLLESNRHNSVLDYLPEYEQLFKNAGY